MRSIFDMRRLLTQPRTYCYVGVFILVVYAKIALDFHHSTSVESMILPAGLGRIGMQERRQTLLSCLSQGQWLPRPGVTMRDANQVEGFIKIARREKGIPPSLQRMDGRCGNTSFEDADRLRYRKVIQRALCDPIGKTPCCYGDRCVARTPETCDCEECYDERRYRHAELSYWDLKSPRQCTLKNFTQAGLCGFLEDRGVKQIKVMGDSLMRHIYSALLILIQNDPHTGALRPDISAETRNHCSGLAQFTEKHCNVQYLEYAGTYCDGRVRMEYVAPYQSGHVLSALGHAYSTLHSKTLFLFGIGLHDDLYWETVISWFLSPVAKLLWWGGSFPDWPQVVWVAPHSPGSLKPPHLLLQNKQRTITYARETSKFLADYGIPTLNTHALTDGMVSWDGTHYGYGVNTQIAHILLSYFELVTAPPGGDNDYLRTSQHVTHK